MSSLRTTLVNAPRAEALRAMFAGLAEQARNDRHIRPFPAFNHAFQRVHALDSHAPPP